MKKRRFPYRPRVAFLGLVLLCSAGSFAADKVPLLISYRGYISTVPDGTFPANVEIKLLDAPDSTTPLWSELHSGVPVTNGNFAVTVGSLNPLPESLVTDAPALYLLVELNGNPAGTPGRLVSVPYAVQAETAGASPNSLDAADGDPAQALIVDSAGNVGIGTAVPDTRLVVDGIIRSGSGGIQFSDGTTQASAADTDLLADILSRLDTLEAAAQFAP